MAGSEMAASRGARGRASIGGSDQSHHNMSSVSLFENQQRQFVQQHAHQPLSQDQLHYQQQNQNQKFAHDEIDVAFNRLMALEAFRRLHPSLIRNLCSYASIERIEKGVLVFRQGDDAINWYALLEGSVDVKVAQSSSGKAGGNSINLAQREQQQATTLTSGSETHSGHDQLQQPKDGVTLCTLGVGTTFGASVMPGKSHNVSVVTNEECTLLRVRRADFQEIFNEQLHLINDVESSPFFPLSSLNKITQSSDSGALTRIRSSISSSLSKFAPPTTGATSSSPPVGRLRRLGSQAGANSQLGRSQVASCGPGQWQQRPATTDGGRPLNQKQQQQVGRRSSLLVGAQQADQKRRQSIASRGQAALVETTGVGVEQFQSQQAAFQSPRHSGTGDGVALCDQSQVASDHEPDQEEEEEEEEPEEPEENVQDDELEEDLNLDSLDASELSSQLMRIGWVLRTLILTETPQMIKNRRVYPNLHHSLLLHGPAMQASNQQQQQQQMSASAKSSKSRTPIKSAMGKHLVSMGSSSQLFAGSSSSAPAVASAQAAAAAVPPAMPQTASSSSSKSVASSAGRKVANYVAASFMRTAVGKPTGLPATSSTSLQQQQQQAKQSLANGRHPQLQPSQQQQQQPLYSASGSFDHQHASLCARDTHARNNHLHAESQEPVQLHRCLVGREMVDWLLQLSQTNTNAGRFVSARLQAVSMWQVLLEQEIILSVPVDPKARPAQPVGAGEADGPQATASKLQQATANKQAQFCDDPQAYYKFYFDCDQEPGDGGQESQEQSTAARSPSPPSQSDVALANETLWWSMKLLSQLAPDACFRLILARQPHERSGEEVDIVYEELQHLKALSHLTNSVKKQLAACVQSEHHARQNTVIFNQGDAGHSWYIILRGSVNVVIVGKGVVCTLHDGDDFGKLALVNDAPRAATIVTNEPNCYFLRVDKHDFNTILRDVEANTVRLKEHGKEVLILQKVAIKEQPPQTTTSTTTTTIDQNHLAGPGQLATTAPSSATNSNTSSLGAINNLGAQAETQVNNSLSLAPQQQQMGVAAQVSEQATPSAGQQQVSTTAAVAAAVAAATSSQCALKYMVMAGTAEKMLEHLLETRIDGQTQTAPLALTKQALCQHDQVANYIQCQGDNFLEDFILTHKIFMPTESLCQELLKQYQSSGGQQQQAAAKQQQQAPVSRQINNLDDEYLVAKKRRVIKFVRFWMLVNREHFFQQQQIQNFVMTLHQKVKLDAQRFGSLQPELKAISRIYELQLEENLESRHRGCQRWIEDIYGNFLPIRRHSGTWQAPGSSSGPPEMSSDGVQQSAGGYQHNLAASELFLASLHTRRFEHKLSTIQPEDELVFRVYCADHSYTTLKCRFDEQAGQIKQVAARNLKLADKELILVHVKSNGERIIYNDLEANICTCLSVNGRLFVCPLDHIDAVSPLPEQDPFQEVYQSLVSVKKQQHQQQPIVEGGENSLSSGNGPSSTTTSGANQQALTSSANFQQQDTQTVQPISSHLLANTPTNYADIKLQMSLSVTKLEEFSSRDIAYCLTQLAWSLLKNMHEFELVYTVFGRNNFKQITANLNVFLRHFNEIQYWVVTQICLSQSLSKRVQILRKFIKVAAHCKEMQNLNAFFAIIMGLSNMAVARLTQTWERLPSKLKRTFSQFESQIDPSRNHRRYRIYLSKLEPPIVPFMPLFLKDMTFAHEGNKTHIENGLINFEKMQMIAQTLRTIRYCKSRSMKLDSSLCKFKSSIRSIELFFRDLKMIDNQRTLTQMSHQLEHRKT